MATTLYVGLGQPPASGPAVAALEATPAPRRDTDRDRLEDEQLASGPAGIKLPLFLPYFEPGQQLYETDLMRLAYRQMLADPDIKAAVFSRLFGVAALDLQVQPADREDPRALAIVEFCKWNLERRLSGGMLGIVWTVFSGGLVDGYSISEPVWARPETRGQWAGKRPLRELKAKDVGNDVVPRLDAFRNIVDLMGLRYNAGKFFDPRDFLIYTHLGLYSNPGGMSEMRAVYLSWWMLDTVQKVRMLGAEKRALPVIVGHYQDVTKKKQLADSLAKVKSSNWLAVPEGVQLEVLNIAASAEDYFRSFTETLRQRIHTGLSLAYLQAMGGGQREERGDSQVHKDTSDLGKWQLSKAVVNYLFNDLEPSSPGLLKRIVDENFLEVTDYPYATLGGVDERELSESLAVDKGLKELGFQHSKKAVAERYGREEAEGPDDLLQPPAGPGGGPGGPGGGPGRPGGGPDPGPPAGLLPGMAEGQGGAGAGVPAGPFRVPDYRQESGYSCGAAALQAALGAFGLNTDEAGLRHALGTDPEAGTPPPALVRVARGLGLDADEYDQMTVGNLRWLTDRGRLVVVPLQAHGSPAGRAALQSGHYVVVDGYDPAGDLVLLEDPRAGRLEVPAQEFDQRWVDQSAAGQVYDHYGIVLGLPAGQRFAERKGGQFAPGGGRVPGGPEEAAGGAAGPDWSARALAREARRDALADADRENQDKTALNAAYQVLQDTHNSLDHGQTVDVEGLRTQFATYADELQAVYRAVGEQLAQAGAHAKEQARYTQAVTNSLATLDRKAQAYLAGVKHWQDAQAKTLALQTSAPDLAEPDLPEEPQEPDEPEYPEEPDPDNYLEGDSDPAYTADYEKWDALQEKLTNAYDAAQAKYDDDHDAWEKETEKIQADHEAAQEKATEKWEAAVEKAEARADKEYEKTGDLMDAYNDAEVDQDEKLADLLDTLRDQIGQRLEAEEDADPEPEEGAAGPAVARHAEDPPAGQAPEPLALGGRDGARAEQLLAASQEEGRRVLAAATRSALERLLAGGPAGVLNARRLLDDDERREVADQLSATRATADLLGRSRIRLRQEQAAKHYAEGAGDVNLLTGRPRLLAEEPVTPAYFSETPTDYSAFAEDLHPLAPAQALAYFTGLVPTLGIDPQRYGPTWERHAFTLAVATDRELLDKVKQAIRQRLATGQDISTAPATIDALLDEAGVGPRQRSYSDMVWRTNALDAYNAGGDRERRDPDVQAAFPVWRYSNPDDARSRPHHAAKNGRYYSVSRSFAEVRGTDLGDLANCRCVPVEIDAREWDELRRQGARLEE